MSVRNPDPGVTRRREPRSDGGIAGSRPPAALVIAVDFASHRVVARQGLIGALENDDVLLSRQRLHDGRVRERAEHVRVDRSHLHTPVLPHVVDRRLDVFRRRSQRHEDGVGVVGLVLADQAVIATGQLGKVAIGILKELEDGREVVPRATPPACSALVLHRAKQTGLVNRSSSARGVASSDEDALAFRRTIDDVSGAPRYSRSGRSVCKRRSRCFEEAVHSFIPVVRLSSVTREE